MDTKITNQAFFLNSLLYDVVCSLAITTTAGVKQGLVGLVFIDRPQFWTVYAMCFRRTNVVSCEVDFCVKRTPLVGAYLPPSTLENIPDLEEALPHFRYLDPIVLGDLNVNIV